MSCPNLSRQCTDKHTNVSNVSPCRKLGHCLLIRMPPTVFKVRLVKYEIPDVFEMTRMTSQVKSKLKCDFIQLW